MSAEHVAARAVKPAKHYDVSADAQIADCLGYLSVEYQPRRRGFFVALAGRLRSIDQW